MEGQLIRSPQGGAEDYQPRGGREELGQLAIEIREQVKKKVKTEIIYFTFYHHCIIIMQCSIIIKKWYAEKVTWGISCR